MSAQTDMSNASIIELYIARAQHRVVRDVMHALSVVQPTDFMDDQLVAVAHLLNQPAPDMDDGLFEDALADLVRVYATAALDKARGNVRAMHRGEFGGGAATLDELDPTWNDDQQPAARRRMLDCETRFTEFLDGLSADDWTTHGTVKLKKVDAGLARFDLIAEAFAAFCRTNKSRSHFELKKAMESMNFVFHAKKRFCQQCFMAVLEHAEDCDPASRERAQKLAVQGLVAVRV